MAIECNRCKEDIKDDTDDYYNRDHTKIECQNCGLIQDVTTKTFTEEELVFEKLSAYSLDKLEAAARKMVDDIDILLLEGLKKEK